MLVGLEVACFWLLFSCGLLYRFLPDFALINWAIFFLINRLGQSFYLHFKKKNLHSTTHTSG
jgi:hypothetical protein